MAFACGPPQKRAVDHDHDGLIGASDQCPHEAEDMDDFEDGDGCYDEDNDGDGVLDADDLCPSEKEDVDNFEDTDGCPDHDNDQDRVVDVNDNCPNEPETYNGRDDDDGCPDREEVQVYTCNFPVEERVYFRQNSAKLDATSREIASLIAATLKQSPEIEIAAVVGYADGKERNAKELALRRAEGIAGAIREAGISSERLRVFSSLAPAQEEETRRVSFYVIQHSGNVVGKWDGQVINTVHPDGAP